MSQERPLDPERPIVDPHHHLWDHGHGAAPFLLQDFVRTVEESGHRIVQSVYVECGSMYRAEGPMDLRPVGETEFANGMAAMAASGRYGMTKVAAGIVGSANLRLGAEVVAVLEAQVAAGNGRLRGIRFPTAHADTGLFGRPPDPRGRGLLLDPALQAAARLLSRFELCLDVWCVHTQLHELANLASACPEVTCVLDHLGSPLERDAHRGRDAPVFAQWRAGLAELARRPNVVVKIGGLGMDLRAALGASAAGTPSTTLAQAWRPYIETCVEMFGASRCMFESNFPVDRATCEYGALWNAFKTVTAGCTEEEKTLLYSRTAMQTYRLG